MGLLEVGEEVREIPGTGSKTEAGKGKEEGELNVGKKNEPVPQPAQSEPSENPARCPAAAHRFGTVLL